MKSPTWVLVISPSGGRAAEVLYANLCTGGFEFFREENVDSYQREVKFFVKHIEAHAAEVEMVLIESNIGIEAHALRGDLRGMFPGMHVEYAKMIKKDAAGGDVATAMLNFALRVVETKAYEK